MAIDRYYTPQALADATGLCVSQCRALIRQSPERLLISRSPNTKKPRYAISERGFRALLEANRRRNLMEEAEKLPPAKREYAKKVVKGQIPGVNPDGTIMNSRQLKAAGLWEKMKKGANANGHH